MGRNLSRLSPSVGPSTAEPSTAAQPSPRSSLSFSLTARRDLHVSWSVGQQRKGNRRRNWEAAVELWCAARELRTLAA
jgi:hypothetical protein